MSYYHTYEKHNNLYDADVAAIIEILIIGTNKKYTLNITNSPKASYMLPLVTPIGKTHTIRLLKQSYISILFDIFIIETCNG